MLDPEQREQKIDPRLQIAEKQIEQLRAELAFYRELVEQHPDYICQLNPDLELSYANPAYRKRFVPQDETGKRSFLDSIIEIDRESYRQRLADLSANTPTVRTRMRLMDASGRFHWVEWKDTVLCGDAGQVIGYQSSGYDITIQQVLQHDLKLQAAFLEQMQDIVVVADVHGMVVYVNRAGARAYGFDTPDEMIGTPATDYMHAPDASAEFNRFRNRIQKSPWYGETSVKRRDGSLLAVEQSAFAIREDGNPTYLATVSRDISTQREAQAALKQSEERFSRIFAMTPVANVILSLESRCFLEVNDTFIRVTGFSREEIIGQRAVDLNLLADPLLLSGLVDMMDGQGIISGIETRFRVKSGEIRNALISAALIDLDEQPCIAIAALDITAQYDQKLHEQAMAGYLRAIVETADELITIQDQKSFERRAVEVMRERLAIERCAIFMIDESQQYLIGTFGTDDHGKTTDEHTMKLPISRIQHTLHFPAEVWAVTEQEPYTFWDDVSGEIRKVGLGWVVTTAIRVGNQLIGMIANDSQITGSAVNHVQQEALAIYASLLGNMIQRRRIEEEFRASNERYRVIVETTQEGIAWLDVESRITYCNEHFATMLGYRMDEILGMQLADLIHEQYHGEMEQHKQTRFSGKSERYDFAFQHKDGSERWLSVSASPIQDEHGVIIGVLAMYTDITERKWAEDALKSARDELEQRVRERTAELEEERNLLRTLIDSMPYNIYAKDLNHRFIIINKTLARVLGGNDTSDIIGKDDYMFYPKEIADRFKATELRIFESGLSLMNQEEYVIDGMDGIEWVISNKVPLRNVSGELIGLVGISHDITALKRAEKILEQKYEDERLFQHYLRMLHEIMVELNEIDDLDIFYRKVVEFGLNKLDFDRMGMFLYEPDQNRAIGTYGTDPQGIIIDEHTLNFVLEPHGVMWNTLQNPHHIYLDEENHPLTHFRETVGYGWNAGSALWQGNQVLGWIMVDNLIHKQPPHPIRLEVLAQYGILVASMLARKQTQVALQRSEWLYRTVIATMSEGIIVQAADGHLETCNAAAEQILGLHVGQIAGKETIPDRWHMIGDSVAQFTSEADRTFVLPRSGEGYAGIIAGVHKADDQIAWVSMNSMPIYGDNLDTRGLVVTTLTDITGSKIAEDALRESEAKYRHLIESMNAGIIIVDQDGKLTFVNDRFCEMLGTTREQIIGQNFSTFVEPQQKQQIMREWNHQQQGAPSSFELDLKRPDGTSLTILINGTPMLTASGTYSGGIAVTTDITAQKEAEDALRRALDRERELGQLKTQFVSTTSHEFRTPLATILTTTEMLMYYRDRYDAAQIDVRLEKIRTQVNHLKQIMDEVLQLARIQARRMEFKPALNDLCQLCEEIAEEFNSSSQHRERVHYQTLQTDIKMVYDPRMMRQIITNLISNALKYSPNSKAVDFTLQPDGEDICLIVQDYGMGIPAESITHLFEPFYRAPNVENISGTGLGLPIVKESVEVHGGTISFTTEVDRGTRFVVRFPYKNMIAPEDLA